MDMKKLAISVALVVVTLAVVYRVSSIRQIVIGQ